MFVYVWVVGCVGECCDDCVFLCFDVCGYELVDELVVWCCVGFGGVCDVVVDD